MSDDTNKREIDDLSGTETTGHEWDGIRELNTPLPRWWLWTFYGTIIWAMGYVIVYPAIPLVNSNTPGVIGYSSRAEVDKSIAAAQEEQAVFIAQIAETEVSDLLNDDELVRFARAGGEAAFKVNCVQCHASGATGSEGYPNLNDDEWIWGGSIEDIYLTIAHGVRYEPDFDTRFGGGEMPNFSQDWLTSEQIESVAHYVASLSGLEGGMATPEGEELFANECSVCHGENGEGLTEMGGPPLNNAIWLYEGSVEGIVSQISNPRNGVMPAWSHRLSDETVKQLAVYVHSLGGGE